MEHQNPALRPGVHELRELKESLVWQKAKQRVIVDKLALLHRTGGAFAPVPVALGLATGEGPGFCHLAVRVQESPEDPLIAPFLQQVMEQTEAAGMEVRVVETGVPRLLVATEEGDGASAASQPLRLGAGVGGPYGAAGTLGLFVQTDGHRSESSRPLALTICGPIPYCWRRPPLPLLHPAGIHGGTDPANRVGAAPQGIELGVGQVLGRSATVVLPLEGWAAEPGRVDPRSLAGLGALAGIRSFGDPFLISPGENVFMVGSTGVRTGQVTAVELDDLDVTNPVTGWPEVYDGQIEIRGDGETFGHPGDAGALVVDQELRGVGILFAGTETGLAYAHPLPIVLQRHGLLLYTAPDESGPEAMAARMRQLHREGTRG